MRTDEWAYLRSCLVPLLPILDRDDVTDIYVNRPGEIWIETLGGAAERHDVTALDETTLMRLARQIASFNHQGISREHPLLSASLPDGSRVQVVAAPATRGPVAIAIRKHLSAGMTLDDYVSSGALRDTRTARSSARPEVDVVARLIAAGDGGQLPQQVDS